MSVRIEVSARINGIVTWFDITDDLVARGARMPESVNYAGVYPDDVTESDDDPLFYDLLGAINDHADTRLRDNFFDGRVHGIKIVDSFRGAFEARLLVDTRYTSRNA